MSERKVTLVIEVDDRDAKTKVAAFDRSVDELKATTSSTSGALSDYERQVQAVVKSKQALTTTMMSTVESLNATREAVQQATGWYQQLEDALVRNTTVTDQTISTQKELFEWLNRGGQGWQGYAQSARDAWEVLRSIRFSDIRAGINGVAEAAGLTVANLGLMGTAGLVLATAYAAWNTGKMISDFLGLEDAIGRATAKWLRWGDATGQATGARQDVINRAIERGANTMITYAAALEFNTQWVNNWKAAASGLSDTLARQDAPRQFAEQMASWKREIDDLNSAGVLPALKAGLQSNLISVKELSDSYRVSVGAIQLYKNQLRDEEEAHKKAESAAAKHRAEQERVKDQFDKQRATLERWTANMEAAAANTDRLTRNLHGLGVALPKINDLMAKRTAVVGELMPDMGVGGFGMPGTVAGSGDTGRGFFGNLFGKAKSAFDPKTIFNSMIGGGLSGLVSAGVGLVGQGLSSLFGSIFKVEEKEVNRTRQAFVDAAGGIATLNEKAHDAGLTLDRMLRAKTVKEYEAAIRELNDAIRFQDQAMQTLDATVQRYGFTINELGPKFRQQKLNEQAASLIQDYRVLIASGIENATVLERMAPAMNEYLHTIMTAGGTIPTQLQGPLQQLVNMGLITDLAGEKMTDLGNLTFAETLDAKFSTLIDTINKLVDAIANRLGTAITNLPDRTIHVGFQVDDMPRFQSERFHGGGEVGRVLPFLPRAHRGLAIDEVPIIAQRGEGVLNRGAMRRIGGAPGLNRLNAGGSGSGVSVSIEGITVERNMDEHDAEELIGKTVVRAMRRRGVRIA